jgi:hypothetical protein
MQSSAARTGVVLLIALGALGFALTGVVVLFFALFVWTAMTWPHPAAPVAEQIRAAHSPIVLEVRYHPGIFGSDGASDTLEVLLTDDATEAQALDLWCTVIVPAGGDQLPPSMLDVEQGEKRVPGGGTAGGHTVLPRSTTVDGKFTYVQPTCPGTAPGASTP